VADEIMGNQDRHGGNWKYGGGVPHGIDHGIVFGGRGGGPFAMAAREAAKQGKFDQAYIDRVRYNVAGLKSEFEKRGLEGQYQGVVNRLNGLFPNGVAKAERPPALPGAVWEHHANPDEHRRFIKLEDGSIKTIHPNGQERMDQGRTARLLEKNLNEQADTGLKRRIDPALPGAIWKNKQDPTEEWHKGENGDILHMNAQGREVLVGDKVPHLEANRHKYELRGPEILASEVRATPRVFASMTRGTR
jgi:hypothetical protein